MRLIIMGIIALTFATTSLLADEKPTLTLKVTSRKDSYTIDRGGKTAEEYAKLFETFLKGKGLGKVPPPVAVDLVVSIVNDGKKPVTITIGADNSEVLFNLQGPKVQYLRPLIATTREFRLGKPVTIEPGKSYDMPYTKLVDGFRNQSRNIYWLEAGDYTLSATYQMPAGDDDKKGPLLTAEKIELKVVEPKK